LYALVPSVSSAYWILSVMTTQVYLVMYLLMFVAAVQLRRKRPRSSVATRLRRSRSSAPSAS
jgi:amino acid transporter